MFVRDAMCTDLVVIDPAASLEDAATLMLARRIHTLLVVEEDGTFVGVIGLRDLFTAPRSASYGGRMTGWRAEEDLRSAWRDVTVRMQMSEHPIVVNEDLSLLAAAALMVNRGKHPLPVLRGGKLVGVISRSDIARAVLTQSHATEAALAGDVVELR